MPQWFRTMRIIKHCDSKRQRNTKISWVSILVEYKNKKEQSNFNNGFSHNILKKTLNWILRAAYKLMTLRVRIERLISSFKLLLKFYQNCQWLLFFTYKILWVFHLFSLILVSDDMYLVGALVALDETSNPDETYIQIGSMRHKMWVQGTETSTPSEGVS